MLLMLLIAGAAAAAAHSWRRRRLYQHTHDECWRFVEWQATFFCTEEFCPSCPHAGGCDAWCGLCDDEPLVPDCNGHRAPSGFRGDGYCDAGLHRYDGELIDFNCPEHGCDGGDCQPGADAYGHEVPCATAAPTSITPAPTPGDTIASIQNSTLAGSHFMDCRPSPRHHALVHVTCVVTLVTKVGFYCQDAAAPWSGVFVHAPYDALTLAICSRAIRVSVRDAYVDEELGSTQLEVAAADDVEILNRYVAVEPLLVDAGALGSFAERESARCLASAEPYEGLLVRIANASLTSVDGYVSVADGSGTTLLGSTAGRFDAADALVRFRASGAAAVDVVGVGRTGFRCENSAGANQGAIEDVLECLSDASQISFIFQVSPRSLHDVSWDSPAPSLQPTPESRPPTRPANRPPLGGNPRPHYAIGYAGNRALRGRSRRWPGAYPAVRGRGPVKSIDDVPSACPTRLLEPVFAACTTWRVGHGRDSIRLTATGQVDLRLRAWPCHRVSAGMHGGRGRAVRRGPGGAVPDRRPRWRRGGGMPRGAGRRAGVRWRGRGGQSDRGHAAGHRTARAQRGDDAVASTTALLPRWLVYRSSPRAGPRRGCRPSTGRQGRRWPGHQT